MKYRETARRLLYAMAAANISQQELANQAGIGKSSISHYVNGSNEPGNKAAYAMANVLGVNPLWLMGIDTDMGPYIASGVTMELTKLEGQIIHALRKSSPDTQAAVCAVLGVKGDSALPEAESITS